MWRLVAGVFYFLLACGCSRGQGDALIPSEQVFRSKSEVDLARAAQVGDTRAVMDIVRQGTSAGSVGKNGATPLWYAFTANKKAAFEKLLELGADPDAVDINGEPLLGDSIMVDKPDWMKVLLTHGANPDGVNTNTRQPILFRAANDGRIHLMEALLKAGADINIRNADGTTALTFASSSRQIETVKFLLQHGADPFLRNAAGNDLAAGLFGPNWNVRSAGLRRDVITRLEQMGIKFDQETIEQAQIRNLGEATGKEPPMWLKNNIGEPNPDWVRANPEQAKLWYQRVLHRGPP
jgi:hypothetical protein